MSTAGGLAAVHCAFLEAVVLPHGRVVEILTVHGEHDFVHAIHARRELCGLEARECLARDRGVPDVTAGAQRPEIGLSFSETRMRLRTHSVAAIW